MRSRHLLQTLAIAALAMGCPMRPNPAYRRDADDATAPADADTPRDADPEPDVEPDVADTDADDDEGGCDQDELFCDGACVSVWDEANCGVCGRICEDDVACTCSGAVAECSRGGRSCYASCAPDDLECGDGCVAQPDDFHCGACGVHCDDASGCQCRPVEGSSSFECMRLVGEAWESC